MIATGAAVLGATAFVPLSAAADDRPVDRGVIPAVEAVVPAPSAPPPAEPARGPAWSTGNRLPVPTAVRAPAVDLDAQVVPIVADRDGALQVPEDGSVVGWWSAGPRPGEAAGTVVLTGHVATWDDGPGALSRVRSLRPGDEVQVSTGRDAWRYRVEAMRSYPKTALPPEVFAAYGRPRLVLVTCGGEFDERTRTYADNVVAFAVPVGRV